MTLSAFKDAVLEWGWKQPHLGILVALYKGYGLSILPLSKDGYDGYVEGTIMNRGFQTYAQVEHDLMAKVDDLILNNGGCVGVKKLPKPVTLRLFHVHNPFVTDQSWGCWQAIVVAVLDEEAARAFLPVDEDYPDSVCMPENWPGDPALFRVTYLGDAAPGIKQGQILASNMGA